MNDSGAAYSPIAKAVAIVLVLAALTAGAYVVCVTIPAGFFGGIFGDGSKRAIELGERFAKDIDAAFHFRPRVTVGEKTVVEANQSIAEYATAQRTFDTTVTREYAWLGSTAHFEIKGSFVGKAGYKVDNGFCWIAISKDGKSISATVPKPEILSVTTTKFEVVDVDGWWTKMPSAEREVAMNDLLARANASLRSTPILADAERNFKDQLEGVIRKNNPVPVTIVREPPPR